MRRSVEVNLRDWRVGSGRVGWGAGVVLWMTLGMTLAAAAQDPKPVQKPAPASAQQPGEAAKPMTKDQAKELFRSVDEILAFASSDSKLPIEHSVKRTLITRDQVNKYLTKKFDEDESARRLERSEIVLKKFGLLDRDFHLRTFMLGLLTEQIAGFYDEKTKTVNLLDWISPEEQKPVLAHELTHALQDQKVGLEKWSNSGTDNVSRTAREDNQHIRNDELETARQAVTEGQAMVVFVDYTLKGSGKTLADSPEIGQRVRDSAADPSGSPLMARAPLLLQRSLIFPYSDGLSFEQAVLVKAGPAAAFAGVLDHPPSSSFEILHPEAWMRHAAVPVLALPDVHPLLDAEWEPYDVGVMGELDVSIMTELWGGQQMAAALSPEWAGGVYYAVQRKGATAAEKLGTGSVGVLYYSKWKNGDSARSFERVYEGELARKYDRVVRREKEERDGEQVYTTNEGDVLLSVTENGLWISEGFPVALARKLRESTVAAQAGGKVQLASGFGGRELSLGMGRVFGGLGTVKTSFQFSLVRCPRPLR